jgi:hypothetical protein
MIAETSIRAREDNAPRADSQRAKILRALESAGKAGLIREEAGERTKIRIQSICPAIKALIEAGLIEDTSRTRPTKARSQAKVLIVSEKYRRSILEDALTEEAGEVEDKQAAMAELGWIRKVSAGYKITEKGWAVIAL